MKTSISCAMCDKKFKRITYLHLKRIHSTTFGEYRLSFPNSETSCDETKAKIGQITKRAWAVSNSGLRNRKDIWESRTQNGTRSGALKGKTYGEIHGKQKAKELKQLRKKVCLRCLGYPTDTQRRQYWYIFINRLRENPEYRLNFVAKSKVARKREWDTMSSEARSKRIRNIMRAVCSKPNISETYLQSLLQFLFPNEWVYTGNGMLIINGKCPDFANVNGRKQLIELYGDFWHRGQNPETRIKLFEKYGYETLVIWEHELYNPKELAKRLVTFTGGSHQD